MTGEEAAAIGSVQKGDRLPPVRLGESSGEREVGLRPSRGLRVLLTVHRADCDACIEYVREIESIREPLEGWGADILIISPDTVPVDDCVLGRVGLPALEWRNL